jgi:hypothetical protein
LRRAIFKVAGRFDGARVATVTVEQEGPYALVRVRPYRRRREFALPLDVVAAGVIYQVVKAELRERRRLRGR